MGGPLDGLRVLDLTRLLPGPFLSLTLADLGADVVKVEAPDGGDWVRYIPPLVGGASAQFIALNRGKRSIGLDLKKPGGAGVLKQLARSADVLLESFRPGVMDRLGVGYEVLKSENPGLIYAAITGYGQDGPYKDRAGHDLNYTALAGTLGRTGVRGGPPVMAGFQLADVAGGGLFGAVGVLAALHARQSTGLGRFIDISMTEGAIAFNVLTLSRHLADGAPVPRGTDQLGGGSACYGVYETADRKYMALAALEPKFFGAFCDAVGRPEWKRRHFGDDDALAKDLAALFLTKPRAEWEALFAGADCCCEPVLDLEELAEHPQHRARGVFYEQPQGDAALRQVRSPLIPRAESALATAAPALGANTRDVLRAAGFSEEDVMRLISDRVVVAA